MWNRRLQSFAVLGLAFALAACAAPWTSERFASRPSTEFNDAAIDSTRPQYVVGYGSLMQDESRAQTVRKAGRLYPRRPLIYQPRASEIDALLSRELPRYFGRIRLKR